MVLGSLNDYFVLGLIRFQPTCAWIKNYIRPLLPR